MNWTEFLDDYSIEYVTRSRNTRRGEISIQCPFCGDDDPSMHMGIALDKDAWGCLRDDSHRGKMPHRLVAALLGISNKQADALVKRYSHSDPDKFGALDFSPPAKIPEEELLVPEWTKIRPAGLTLRFWRYLERRGFDNPGKVIEQYSLLCCLTGRFKDRLIFPLFHNGRVLGWTGRALINPVHAPRYLSAGDVKGTLFNYDNLSGGALLFVCEGPFDALKLDYYGRLRRVHATCGFGTSLSFEQIMLLRALAKSYDRMVVLFDYDAYAPAATAVDWLDRADIMQLPQGVKDPGAMGVNDIHNLITVAMSGA